jgi:ribonuclease T2
MKKILFTSLILSLPVLLVAKKPHVYETAMLECPAYNNMKQTTNTNNVQLEEGKAYRVLQRNDGQVLVLVEGQRIAQRWVKEVCVSKNNKQSETVKKKTNTSSKVTAKQNLLAISWQNAFCQMNQYKKECKSMDRDSFGAYEFVLHGLWPQPRNNLYCDVSKKQIGMDKNKQWYSLDKLELTSETRKELSELMPGYASYLHRHEWVKHGTCYGTDEEQYYKDSLNLLKQVNNSKVGEYFKNRIGENVYLREIRQVFDKEFGHGAGDHVTMRCRKGLVTELWLHLGNGSDELSELLKGGERPKSKCHKGRVDAVGF